MLAGTLAAPSPHGYVAAMNKGARIQRKATKAAAATVPKETKPIPDPHLYPHLQVISIQEASQGAGAQRAQTSQKPAVGADQGVQTGSQVDQGTIGGSSQ